MVVLALENAVPKPKRTKPKAADKPAGEKKQFNVRFDEEMTSRIEAAALGLGIDGTNLLRMIVKENLPHYELRAERATSKRLPDHLSSRSSAT